MKSSHQMVGEGCKGTILDPLTRLVAIKRILFNIFSFERYTGSLKSNVKNFLRYEIIIYLLEAL